MVEESVELTTEKRIGNLHKALNMLENKISGKLIVETEKNNLAIINEKTVTEEKTPGFELGKELKEVKGPYIEIAGPTFEGFGVVDFDKLPRALTTTNIEPGLPLYNPETGQLMTHWGKVDIQVDSTKMPFADGQVGALFGSCVLSETLPATTKEAERVLEKGGLLVLQRIGEKEYTDLKANNTFMMKYHRSTLSSDRVITHTVVLKKNY